VDGGFAPPHIGIIETGKIVVNERRAMQQFYGRRSALRYRGLVTAAGLGNG
jgi:hypothetical protein